MSEYVYTEPGNKGGAPKQYSLCSNRAYGQTLFLGCSVKSYNSSLGWNGEASRLTVEIIEDDCSYPNITNRPSIDTDHYTNNRFSNTFAKDTNGLSLVPGKVYYIPENGKIVSKYYYNSDPGFVGETMDIMGCPVYFKHDDFEFVGIVKSWDTTGDSGGTRSYSIIIESPSELLQNTTAIIGDYHGFIFRRSASSQRYGFPGYLRIESDDVYSGTIAQQNTPNVLNPYGYWEQFGFGGANKNDQGMPALRIIDAITALTSTNFNSAGPEVYKYSSFARILGRSPTYKSDGSFINFLDHTNCGMILPVSDVFDYPRMGYRLDLSQIRDENLLQYYRISGSTITLYELISNICSNTGKEYYVTIDMEIDGNVIVPVITVNTISVLNQPPEGAINAFIDYAKNQGTVVSSYTRGEEYNSGKSVRSMYIGGKQQRLYQVKNTKYSVRQTTLRYNAYSNQFISIDHSANNLYKIPDENNTRNPDLYSSDTSQYGRVELYGDNDNYKPLLPINGSVGSYSNGYYASSDADAICPYFGNNSLTGRIRAVYHHYTGWVVRFDTQEIGVALNYTFNNSQTVLVSENEIRAAMIGVDSYVGFMSAVLGDGGYVDVWEKVIKPIVGPIAARAIMSHGIMQVYNAYNNSRGGTSSVPMGSQSASLSESLLLDILNKLQKFFGDIGNTYYGKQFMVTIPTPSYWTDSRPFNPPIRVGSDAFGNDIYMIDGSQQTYYSFEPADFAWEEPGNMIDDYLMVGSSDANVLAKEDGTFETILGYNGSYQVNYPKIFAKARLATGQSSPTSNAFNFSKFDTFLKAGSSIQSTLPQDFLEPGLDLSNNQDLYIINAGFQNDAYNNQVVPSQRVYAKASVEKTIYPYATLDGSVIAKIIVTCDGLNINPIYPEALSVNVAAVEYLANSYVGVYANIGRQILSLCGFFNGAGSQDKDNSQYNNLSLAPKAAIPDFAAIPIQFNNAVYGPWVSSPDIAVNNIFTNNGFLRLENLVGGTKVEVDTDLVPWNYGGMRVLDEAAMQKVGADNDYRSTIEQGRLVIYGLPTFGLGQELKYAGYLFNGPTINNIQVQINENGPLTTYTFRTFTRKFTLFNKENADKLKTNALNTLKLNKTISQNIRSVISKIRSASRGGLVSNNYTTSKLLAYSPMNLLVGYSQPFINRKARRIPGVFSPGNWTLDSLKKNTTVTVQDARELPQEFNNQYASKSIMSLDGLLTPASFYPTFLNSTTHFKKYETQHCPFCNGSKYYLINNQQTYCFYCSPSSASSAPAKIASVTQMPPFVLSDEVDASIINNPNAITAFVQNNVLTKTINYVNLNPFIMPVGELRNQFAQDNDYNSHHINIVARSLTPMKGSLSFNDNLSTDQDGLEYYDQNNEFCNLDWNDKVFNDENGIPNTPNLYQTNYRFLALRGPLLVNGWGFDTEGYPVPNASGDPKFVDDNGNPLRIKNIYDQGSTDPSYDGDIIVGKNQNWDGTKWSAPYKEMNFAKGWGLRPDSWPVGPVDLRWDDSRKVWTAPSNSYKLVNVQLEDNLLPPFPARGFLDAVDKSSPLPNGLRRLVFVKDSAENYGAPRGAKLLCFYDDTTGFYEPISKQNIITSGIIRTDGTALIYNSYSKGFDALTGLPENPELIQVYFTNMLNFNIQDNQIGLFTFMKDQWVLTSANSCHSDTVT